MQNGNPETKGRVRLRERKECWQKSGANITGYMIRLNILRSTRAFDGHFYVDIVDRAIGSGSGRHEQY